MVPRETQTQNYWTKFKVGDSDLERLTTVFIEDELPRALEDLALILIRWRCQQEESLIKRELSKGALYQPQKSFGVGEALVFPALNYAVGAIEGIRPGHNPEFGEFQVVQVKLEGQKRMREFATELQVPHRLNAEQFDGAEHGLLSPEDIYKTYGSWVREKLESYLKDSSELCRVMGRWFPKSLLIEIGEGHLNLIEAILDMNAGGPLSSATFLQDLDLPTEINDTLKVFSLNHSLDQNERFDEVGPAGEILWFLRRMEPKAILRPPDYLSLRQVPYDRALLDVSMLTLEQSIADEWSEGLFAPLKEPEELTFVLTFPHWRSGTLPLTPRLATFFPTGRARRIRFTFRDVHTGETWPGWVVREKEFIFGLNDWYEANELPAGAYIQLQRGTEPDVVEIGFQRRRPKREWVRTASSVKGQLTFEMQMRSVSCEYDELMIVAVEDIDALDELWTQVEQGRESNLRLLHGIFPQLAKLNPQGTVHAKTIYSAINVVRRLTPGAVFAELVASSSCVSVGDNYWLFKR